MEIKPDTPSLTTATMGFADFLSILQKKDFSGKNIFCIIDAAIDDNLYHEIKNSGWDYRCLYKKGVHYEGERLTDALAATAVYLLLLDPDKVPVEQFIGRQLGKHRVIFLQANASIGELTDHFSGLLKAMDENGNLFNFRYFDPRILRVYLPTCTEEEKHIFYGPAQIFWAEDRDNGMLEFPAKTEAPSEKKSLKLAVKKPEKPVDATGIFSTAETKRTTQDDSLTGFGMIGEFSQYDGINDTR
jgi:hypothetical protein